MLILFLVIFWHFSVKSLSEIALVAPPPIINVLYNIRLKLMICRDTISQTSSI